MLEFLKTCFSINLNEYEYIGIDLEINKILAMLFTALAVGIVLYNNYRRSIITVLSQLIRHGAKSEETAKTLRELRLDGIGAVRRMLLGDNLLTKLVARVDTDGKISEGETEENTKKTVDLSSARFYVKEEKYLLAESMSTRRDHSLLNTVIACVFTVIFGVCIIACMPGILNIINNLLQ